MKFPDKKKERIDSVINMHAFASLGHILVDCLNQTFLSDVTSFISYTTFHL